MTCWAGPVAQTAPKGVASAADPTDFVTKYSYDRVGQVLKVETPFVDTDDSTKTPTTTFEYDLVGNQITVIDPLKKASAATDYTSTAVYDLSHRVTAAIDAAGYTSKTEYDVDDLVTAEITALGHGQKTVYDEPYILSEIMYKCWARLRCPYVEVPECLTFVELRVRRQCAIGNPASGFRRIGRTMAMES